MPVNGILFCLLQNRQNSLAPSNILSQCIMVSFYELKKKLKQQASERIQLFITNYNTKARSMQFFQLGSFKAGIFCKIINFLF